MKQKCTHMPAKCAQKCYGCLFLTSGIQGGDFSLQFPGIFWACLFKKLENYESDIRLLSKQYKHICK